MRRVRRAAVAALSLVLGCATPRAASPALPPAEPPPEPAAAPAAEPPATPPAPAPVAKAEPAKRRLVVEAPANPDSAPKLGPETRDYDDEHLALDLDLDLDHGSLKGTATHTMTALADLSTVRMHLLDMTVSSVTTGEGADCTASVQDGILSIGLDHPRKKGERFSLTIAYGGTPKSGLWFYKPTPEHPDIPVQVWSQGEGEENRHWIPCYDLPDERLTTSMRVVVPANLQTLGNGVETKTETLAGGRVAHTWTLERPYVSYLITLVVGTFDDVMRDAAGVEQHDLVPPGWGPWCGEVFGRTPDMMGFYQDYTGQKYAWPRYSQVTVWDFSWGGMENTSATTLNMRALHKEGVRPDYSADGLVAHELAHQWFGDLITCRTMNHIWLNEGFATYFTDLWVEHHDGADDFAVACLGEREGYMNGVDLKKTSERERPKKATDCGDMSEHQYVKGASVLHMLRKLLGDDVFKAGIQRYVADNRDKSVETEALRASMEAESKTDLKWFFDQWVYGSGFPELEVAWYHDADAHETRLVLRQTQPVTENMPVFRLPFQVGIVDADGNAESFTATMTQAAQEFAIPTKVGQKPPVLTFDPNHWILARVHEVKPRSMWEAQLASDPTNVGRLLAARALADFGLEPVDALAKAATSDSNYSVRSEACTAIGGIWAAANVAARRRLHDHNPSESKVAARLPDEVIVPGPDPSHPTVFDRAGTALITATEDIDSRVRRAAVNAMGSCDPTFVGDTLKHHLANDPSVYVAADAGWALGKCKAPGAYEALVEGLKRESHRDQIRQRIMDGFKDLGDPRGAAVAMGYLDYSWGHGIQHQLRHSAFDAMVALAPEAPETKAWVLKLLNDPYFRMKLWAAEAAVKLKITDALPILDDLAKNATGPGVTDGMKSAAEKLRAPAKPAE